MRRHQGCQKRSRRRRRGSERRIWRGELGGDENGGDGSGGDDGDDGGDADFGVNAVNMVGQFRKRR